MKVTATAVYRGANVFAPVSVLRHGVDLGALAGRTADDLGPGFAEGLAACLPEVALEGASVAQVVARAAVALQNRAGTEHAFAGAFPGPDPGVWQVVHACESPAIGYQAVLLALALVGRLAGADLAPAERPPEDWDFARAFAAFAAFAASRSPGPSTALLVKAAEARGIPWFARDDTATLIQFGHGRFQKRFAEFLTSDTSDVAFRVATDKAVTHRILRRLALPVPPQRLVAGEEDAVAAAEAMGYPVVVKPNGLGRGVGVKTRLGDAAAVRAAFAEAMRGPMGVVVERFVAGAEFRLLVVGGELAGAYQRVPPHVVGDGTHTVEDLVALVNRGEGRGAELTLDHYRRLELDDEADRLLAEAGHSRTSVPKTGEALRLRAIPRLDFGGTARDVTRLVHPDNRLMAVRAAAAVGLDIAGVDFITADIRRSYREVGGAICEVNRTPGVRGHLMGGDGAPDVLGAVLDHLYPPGAPSRVPIAAVAGAAGTGAVARLLAHVLAAAGRSVGLAADGAVSVGGAPVGAGGMLGADAAQAVLRHPFVEAAVLDIRPGPLLAQGTGFEACDVAVALGAGAGSGGDAGAPERLARALGVVARAARDTLVLDAGDPLCRGLAENAGARHLCYVCGDLDDPLVRDHVDGGGRAVVAAADGADPVLHDGERRLALTDGAPLPGAAGGDDPGAVVAIMAAAAAAYALGTDVDVIRGALADAPPTADAAEAAP